MLLQCFYLYTLDLQFSKNGDLDPWEELLRPFAKDLQAQNCLIISPGQSLVSPAFMSHCSTKTIVGTYCCYLY